MPEAPPQQSPEMQTVRVQSDDGSWVTLTIPVEGKARKRTIEFDPRIPGAKGTFSEDIREKIVLYRGHTASLLPRVHIGRWLRLGWTAEPTSEPPARPFACTKMKANELGIDVPCGKAFRRKAYLAVHIRAAHEDMTMDEQDELISGFVDGGIKSDRERALEERLANLEAILRGTPLPVPNDPLTPEDYTKEVIEAEDKTHTCKAKGALGKYDPNCLRCTLLKHQKEMRKTAVG